MTWIEGVGDEVTACITAAALLILIIIAWCSTAVSERAFGYYILVIERRPRIFQSSQASSRVSEVPQNETLVSPTASPGESSEPHSKIESQKTDCDKENSESSSNETSSGSTSIDHCIEKKSNDKSVSECKVLLGESSSSKLHVENSAAKLPSLSQETKETLHEAAAILDEGKVFSDESSVSKLHIENGAAKLPSLSQETNDIFHEAAAILDDSDQIHIRLKFLNDTQQEVTARLGDKVGDFKRRHFAEDLASNKIVRLIFNGQVLRNDQDTLQSYGVNNGCVVHCLIVSSSSPTPISTTEEREGLEVGSLMLPLFGLILSLIWYCRVQHRQYFNTSSTLALTGITCLFFFVLIAIHWPYQQDNRQRITELENSHQRNNSISLEDIHTPGNSVIQNTHSTT